MAVRLDYHIRETTRNFKRNSSLTFATILTVMIALGLIGLALLATAGVNQLGAIYEDEVEFIVWLREPDIETAECAAADEASRQSCDAAKAQYQDLITRLTEDLNESPFIAPPVEFINSAQTYEEFQRYYSDSPEILEIVSADSMPESFKVTPRDTGSSVIREVREQFESEPGVRSISAAEDLIADVRRFSRVSNLLMLLVGALAIIASALLMYNSIRTAVFARRKEIEVMRLVGATKWFIRIPFMLEALLQGLIGSAASIALVISANLFLIPPIEGIGPRFVGLQVSAFAFSDWSIFGISMVLLIIGAFLGAGAAGIAVSKYLDA